MPSVPERPFAAWLLACFAGFAVLEVSALRRGGHATLSRCLEHWLRCRSHRRLGPALFAAFWAALAWHVAALTPTTEETPCSA